jgi:serine/threonine-protein kinase RsbW
VKSQKIILSIGSELDNVPLIGMAVHRICSNVNFDEEASYNMELCVVEAVNNCILHAYENAPQHEVKVGIELFRDRITFSVCDTGKAMSSLSENISELKSPPLNRTDFPQSGMGLFLIHEIMDDVLYESDGSHNTLIMTKKFSGFTR